MEVVELQSGEMQWFSYSSHGVAVLQYVQEFHSSAAQQFHSSTAPHVQEQEQCIWRNASHRVARKQLGARLIHFASFHALLDCERLNDDVDVNFISNTTKGQHQQSYEETLQKLRNCPYFRYSR